MNAAGALPHEDSGGSLRSLQQLDPAPIESPSAQEKQAPLVIQDEKNREAAIEKTGGTTRNLSRGGGRGAIYYLTRIQRYSSYAMSAFTSLHLANVSLIPAVTRSVPGSETYLLMTREIYQTSISEPLLVGLPVLAHIGSGVALRILRMWQNKARYGGAAPAAHKSVGANASHVWPSISYISISGYAFAVFYAAHVFVNRALPLLVEGDSSNIGLAYVSHGFARHPVVARLAYVGLIAAGCGHMVWGMVKWFGSAPSTKGSLGSGSRLVDNKVRRRRRRHWLLVQGVAVGVAALWAVGGLGVVGRGGLSDGWIGKLYDDMFARVSL